MNDNAAETDRPTFQFDYTNHEGRKTRPRVLVDTIAFWHGATQWHPEPQMLMKAFDVDKGSVGAWRDYAVAEIVWPGEVLFGLRLAWNAVNVLGAPASAHGDGQDCERCKGIEDALNAIDEVNVQIGGEAFYSKRVLQSTLAGEVAKLSSVMVEPCPFCGAEMVEVAAFRTRTTNTFVHDDTGESCPAESVRLVFDENARPEHADRLTLWNAAARAGSNHG